MRDLTVKDLLDLVDSEAPNPADRIERMYGWHFERSMTAVRLTLGLAATLLVAMLVALVQNKSGTPDVLIGGGFAAAAATATYGVYRFWELRRIHREYVASLRLLGEINPLGAFLRRYRQS